MKRKRWPLILLPLGFLILLTLGLLMASFLPVYLAHQAGLGEKEKIQALWEEKEEKETGPKPRAGGLWLSFDDLSVADWYGVRDLFLEAQARVTFFVNDIRRLSPEEVGWLRELAQDGHEVGSHGLDHRNAAEFVEEEGIQAYLDLEIHPSKLGLEEIGIKAKSFAYPYGARTEETTQALLEEFTLLRGTTYTDEETRVKDLDAAYVQAEGSRPLVLAVGIDEIYGNSLEEIQAGMDRAKERGEVLLLYGHKIQEDPAEDAYASSRDKLKAILNYARDQGLAFYTSQDLLP